MKLEEIVIEALNKAKAKDIVKYDLDGASPFFDSIFLATVTSTRQASGVISYLEDLISDTEYKIRNIEGENTEWVLIDLNDIVLSILTEKERQHFELDKLYAIYKKRNV